MTKKITSMGGIGWLVLILFFAGGIPARAQTPFTSYVMSDYICALPYIQAIADVWGPPFPLQPRFHVAPGYSFASYAPTGNYALGGNWDIDGGGVGHGSPANGTMSQRMIHFNTMTSNAPGRGYEFWDYDDALATYISVTPFIPASATSHPGPVQYDNTPTSWFDAYDLLDTSDASALGPVGRANYVGVSAPSTPSGSVTPVTTFGSLGAGSFIYPKVWNTLSNAGQGSSAWAGDGLTMAPSDAPLWAQIPIGSLLSNWNTTGGSMIVMGQTITNGSQDPTYGKVNVCRAWIGSLGGTSLGDMVVYYPTTSGVTTLAYPGIAAVLADGDNGTSSIGINARVIGGHSYLDLYKISSTLIDNTHYATTGQYTIPTSGGVVPSTMTVTSLPGTSYPNGYYGSRQQIVRSPSLLLTGCWMPELYAPSSVAWVLRTLDAVLLPFGVSINNPRVGSTFSAWIYGGSTPGPTLRYAYSQRTGGSVGAPVWGDTTWYDYHIVPYGTTGIPAATYQGFKPNGTIVGDSSGTDTSYPGSMVVPDKVYANFTYWKSIDVTGYASNYLYVQASSTILVMDGSPLNYLASGGGAVYGNVTGTPSVVGASGSGVGSLGGTAGTVIVNYSIHN